MYFFSAFACWVMIDGWFQVWWLQEAFNDGLIDFSVRYLCVYQDKGEKYGT